jgi:hypothetical protein
LLPEKQAILDRVRAALDYLPDDEGEAALNHPWFAQQLNLIVGSLTHQYISVWEEMAAIAVLGLPFSQMLISEGHPPGDERPNGQPVLRRIV